MFHISQKKYPLKFLFHQGVIIRKVYDTMLAEYILTNGLQYSGRDLATLAMKYGNIYLPTDTAIALWEAELLGQFSDGAWENSKPNNHWKIWTELKVKKGNPKVETKIMPQKTPISELNDQVITDRGFPYAKKNLILQLIKMFTYSKK